MLSMDQVVIIDNHLTDNDGRLSVELSITLNGKPQVEVSKKVSKRSMLFTTDKNIHILMETKYLEIFVIFSN